MVSQTTTSASNDAALASGLLRRTKPATAAVEDQVVVTAELIDVHQRHAICAPCCSASSRRFVFADRERRCREIDDDLRADTHEVLRRDRGDSAGVSEVAVVPDVFADADADARAGNVDHLRPWNGSKRAVFVEDVVMREAAPCGTAAAPCRP